MTAREFYVESRKQEKARTQNVLKALPQDKFSYKPHDRSPSAEQIVWTMTNEMKACAHLIDSGQLTFERVPAPAPDKIIALFNEYYDDLLHRASKMSEADWNKPGKFVLGGEVRSEQPIGMFLWLFHNDMIHHRGQLAAYIRPMGGKVPSIYGPSADDPGN